MRDPCDHDHPPTGLHGPNLIAALTRAEIRCGQHGERLTAPRRRVLELLLAAGQPAKAYDLIAAFGADGEPAKPPTVYRALDFLTRLGFAHRIESLNAFVACHGDEDGHAAAFLICDCCGSTREESLVSQELSSLGEAAGFRLTGVTIEAHGVCIGCRS